MRRRTRRTTTRPIVCPAATQTQLKMARNSVMRAVYDQPPNPKERNPPADRRCSRGIPRRGLVRPFPYRGESRPWERPGSWWTPRSSKPLKRRTNSAWWVRFPSAPVPPEPPSRAPRPRMRDASGGDAAAPGCRFRRATHPPAQLRASRACDPLHPASACECGFRPASLPPVHRLR